MKKLLLCAMCMAALTACNGGKNKQEEAFSEERDSLMRIINDKDAELNEVMGTINAIQDGFRRINEAEGRITVNNGDVESEASQQVIRENLEFIQDAMEQNRTMINQLKEKLRASNLNSEKLKKVVDDLTAQLEAQKIRVQELEALVAEKDVLIAEKEETISDLNENVNVLTEENTAKAATVAAQDKKLHSAWYVFGSKSELKQQRILQSGDVLQGSFNNDYFTAVDTREFKDLKLYSKSAKLLTTHPSGSYNLEKDNKGQYVLHITDADKFWSVSKYLVVQVR